VIVYVPALSADAVSEQLPTPPLPSVAEHSFVDPLVTFTIPDGFADTEADVTVAVNLSDPSEPNRTDDADNPNATVVATEVVEAETPPRTVKKYGPSVTVGQPETVSSSLVE